MSKVSTNLMHLLYNVNIYLKIFFFRSYLFTLPIGHELIPGIAVFIKHVKIVMDFFTL